MRIDRGRGIYGWKNRGREDYRPWGSVRQALWHRRVGSFYSDGSYEPIFADEIEIEGGQSGASYAAPVRTAIAVR